MAEEASSPSSPSSLPKLSRRKSKKKSSPPPPPTLLFNREEEVAKLQDIFVQTFGNKQVDEDASVTTAATSSTGEYSQDGGGNDLYSPTMHTGKHKKLKSKKKERLLQLAAEARAEQGRGPQQQQVVQNTTRHVAILVSPAGTGKTTLVQSNLQPLIHQSGGYFLTSSSSHSSNAATQSLLLPPPLSTFQNLMTNWLHQILKRKSRDRSEILSKIQRELQLNLDSTELCLLLQVFPLLQKVFSDKSDALKYTPPMAHNFQKHPNNFAVMFRTLFRIVAAAVPNTKPIVLFLDDLHDLCAIDDDTANDTTVEETERSNLSSASKAKGPAFLQGQPTKTQSSATLVLGLIKWLLLDIQNMPNILAVLAFQPVPFYHPLTAFLQQLEATPLAKQGRLQFCPIVCPNLTETDVYQWLQHLFVKSNDGSEDTASSITPQVLHDMSTQIIQNVVLTAGGNPFATQLLLEQVQKIVLTQEDVDIPAAIAVMTAKLDRMEKIKRRRQMAKDADAAADSNSKHGRRFQNTKKPPSDDLMENLDSSLRSLNMDDSETEDDPAILALSRHIQLLVDGKLKPSTKRLCYLITAYCIGRRQSSDPQSTSISTEQLRSVWRLFDSDGSSDGVNEAVADAASSGMFQLLEKSSSKSATGKECSLSFTCSTFRDVIYSNIMTASDRSAYHAKLALSLYKDGSNDVSAATTHKQRGFEDLGNLEIKQSLSVMCLQAGDQAIEWSQFEVACQYYAMGIKTLDHCVSKLMMSPSSPRRGSKGNGTVTAWTASTDSYDTNLALHLGVSRACAYLNHVGDSSRYSNEALHHIKHSSGSKENSTKSSVERAKATAVQIQCHVRSQKFSDATHLSIKALGKLGESSISAADAKSSGGQESDLKSVRKMLSSRLKRNNGSSSTNMRVAANEIVESMPLLTDPKSIQAILIYDLLLGPAFLEQASLISAVACRMVKLTLQSGGGMCPQSAMGFMAMASILYSVGDSEYGGFCEYIAIEMNETFQDKAIRGRLLVIQNSLSLPRRGFPQELKVAYRLCNDVSDPEFAMLSTVVSVADLFVAGGPLNETAEAMKGVYQVLSTRNNQQLLFVMRPLFQMALNLLGVESTRASQENNHHEPHVLQGNIIASEDQEVTYARETHNVKAEFANYLAQATLCFHMHKFELCREAIEKCNGLPQSETSVLASLDVHWLFVDAMSAICLLWKQSRHADSKEAAKLKKKYVAVAERCLKRLQAYAAASPDLVDQKIYMIQAELQVLAGQIEGAMELYARAMDHSEGYDITSDRALACERAGLALRANHREDEALDYLEDSMSFYRQYGALAKVNHVKGNVIPGWDD